MIRHPPRPPLFPYPTLFRSEGEPLLTLPAKDPDRPHDNNIFANFIACVRSRKPEDLVAPLIEGHYSSALCHLGNISYRLGSERSEEHTSELQSQSNLVCRLL